MTSRIPNNFVKDRNLLAIFQCDRGPGRARGDLWGWPSGAGAGGGWGKAPGRFLSEPAWGGGVMNRPSACTFHKAVSAAQGPAALYAG